MTSSLLDRPRLEPAAMRRLGPEALAVAAIGWALWYLAGHFGGVDLRHAVRGLAPLVLALPAAARGLEAVGRRGAIAAAVLSGGLVLSIAAAAYRSDAVAPLLGYAAMLVAAFATAAIWGRSWGPAAVAAVTLGAGARAWWVGFEVWYGSSLDATVDRWMSLPWHNQSGTLMAALAVALAVAAVTARGPRAVVWGGAASLAGAAALLSGSRGSAVALVVGCAAGLAAAPRRWWRWAPLAAGTVLVMAALTALPGAAPTDGGESLPAAESGSARLGHWSAALAMFVDDPITGHGIGSYRLASPRWAPGDVNPTSHVHNEYLELFAEGGIVVGVPAMVLLAGVGAAAVAGLRRRHRESGRARVAAGATASWFTLAAHAGIDFDWLFPLLAVSFAVTAGVVVADRARGGGGSWAVWAVAALLLVAVGAGYVEGFRHAEGRVHPPWNADAAAAAAEVAIEVGDPERALSLSRRAAQWNPGDPRPPMWEALAVVTRDGGDPGAVVAAAEAARPGFGIRLDAASALIAAGEVAAAGHLVEGVIADFDDYQGWNLAGGSAVAYRLRVDIAGLSSGCEGARAAAAGAEATPLATAFGSEDYGARADRYCGQ